MQRSYASVLAAGLDSSDDTHVQFTVGTKVPKPEVVSNKCLHCDKTKFSGLETCFDCRNKVPEEPHPCKTEGCVNECTFNRRTKTYFEICNTCKWKCPTNGCDGTRTKGQKVCDYCFMTCKTEGCTNERNKSKDGRLFPICRKCYVEKFIKCACGNRRGFDQDGNRYPKCASCVDTSN